VGRFDAPLTAHAISLALGFGALLVIDRHQWFAGDEWDILTRFDLSHHPLRLLIPHNEHLSLIPFLIFKGLFAVVGLRAFWPYVAVLALFHVATAHVLWRLLRRNSVEPWLAVGLTSVFLFLGAGSFNLLIPWQLSFVGSLAFGLASLEVIDSDRPLSPARLAAVWALCTCSILSSGLGPAFAVTAAFYAWLRHGRRSAILVSAVPLALYAGWFLVVGRQHVTALGMVGKTALLQVPDFVWIGLTSALEHGSGLKGAGATLLLALGVFLVRQRVWQEPSTRLAAALALGAVIFFAAIAPGRLLFGPEYASQSRYIYVATGMLLVPVGLALSAVVRRGWAPVTLLVLILAAMTARGAYELKTAADQRAAVIVDEKARILAAGRLLADHAPIVAPDGAIVQADSLTVGALRHLVAHDALPLQDAPGDNDANALDARVELQTRLNASEAATPAGAATTVRAVGISTEAEHEGCVDVASVGDASRIWIDTHGPSSIVLTARQGGMLRVRLESSAEGRVVSQPADTSLAPGRRYELVSDAPGTVLVLSLPPGLNNICGAGLRPS
jgi:hypothetical protein